MNNSIGLISKLLKNNIIKATSGFITLYAFYKWDKAKQALKVKNMNEKSLIDLFDRIDINKDGKISEKELKVALHNAGLDINKIVINKMIEAADENRDGTISKDEWIHICKNEKSHTPHVHLPNLNNKPFIPIHFDDLNDYHHEEQQKIPKVHFPTYKEEIEK